MLHVNMNVVIETIHEMVQTNEYGQFLIVDILIRL